MRQDVRGNEALHARPIGPQDGAERFRVASARPEGFLLPPPGSWSVPFLSFSPAALRAEGVRERCPVQEECAAPYGIVTAGGENFWGKKLGEGPFSKGALPPPLTPLKRSTGGEAARREPLYGTGRDCCENRERSGVSCTAGGRGALAPRTGSRGSRPLAAGGILSALKLEAQKGARDPDKWPFIR